MLHFQSKEQSIYHSIEIQEIWIWIDLFFFFFSCTQVQKTHSILLKLTLVLIELFSTGYPRDVRDSVNQSMAGKVE